MSLLTPFDDTSERLVEPPSNEQPSPKINLEPQKMPVFIKHNRTTFLDESKWRFQFLTTSFRFRDI